MNKLLLLLLLTSITATAEIVPGGTSVAPTFPSGISLDVTAMSNADATVLG